MDAIYVYIDMYCGGSHLEFVGYCYSVPVLYHPGDSLIHHIQCAIALFVAHLAHLQQYILTAGGHLRLADYLGVPGHDFIVCNTLKLDEYLKRRP